SRESLAAQDFRPFRALRDLPMAMSAHVVFTALDPERPATQSRVVIDEIVRGAIGFEGLLMTDDLSMHALTGPFRERAELAFRA
ncbi:glycoside hydrolase family 3 N-terminal domain-containing protein, partial [Acinetobacter baumannii]|uniref:glycoside hydrolase family 3 N-terminal domain-containing protein n=1 Tax=Acinetobacter baumannii TaxID=470 RepID=UPI000DFFD9E8